MDFSAFENSHAHSTENPTAISIPQAFVSATFIGANRDAQVETSNKTTHYQNYFIGQNRDKWASGVYGYGQVNYQSIYEGIDLVFFGINELESNLITIYPNPFTNSTTLDFGKQLTSNHTIIIYDLLGQQVFNYNQFKGSNLKIEKNQLSSGVYILSVYNANNSEVFTVKLIKSAQ